MILSEPGRRRFPARLLALVVALAMVGGALAIRELIIKDEGSSADGADDSDRDSDDRLRIACIVELAEVCGTLDANVTVEAAGTTAARLTALADGADAEIDAWVTFAPWPEIVRDARARAGVDELLGADTSALARTRLAVAARRDRADVLLAACDGMLTWRCIGDVAGTPWSDIGGEGTWGAVRPAHPEPQLSATGLLVLGHAVGGYLATPEIPADDVSRLDWETSDEFPGWFQRLERSVPDDAFDPDTDPFARWLQTRPVGARYDIVTATEAAALRALARAAADVRDAAVLLYPAPVATADVVLAPVGGAGDAGALNDPLRDALLDAGYRADDAGDPPLPATDGLPAPGALDALRGLWEEVVR
ncbi:MAG: hypothetical protein ACT4OX_14065 [Actinomycetota bacterium]